MSENWIRSGINWLNKKRPGWDKVGNSNSLLFPENKKAVNKPTP